ncbi:hypothetical protein D910_09718 [Dendroctonus ponderosae]|uniref:Uncharacterized protein n=1 Tax=Dendroctonus ponderosae TaxID=77166 RepID=U4UEL3_DENPD|nr:hypothetical protein D910_09718 [Dendroctonus ponderosae]
MGALIVGLLSGLAYLICHFSMVIYRRNYRMKCQQEVGLKASEGVNQFKRLHMSRKFMYPTITPHHGTGSFAKCYLGGPQKTATTPKNIRKVATQIEQNPRRSGRKMAEKERMKHVLENELKVAPSKF